MPNDRANALIDEALRNKNRLNSRMKHMTRVDVSLTGKER